MMRAINFIGEYWPLLMVLLLAMLLLSCILTAAEWLSLNWYRLQLFLEHLQR